MNTRTAQIIPEHGPSPLVDSAERRAINQALNKALTRPLPPAPALTVKNLDALPATDFVQDSMIVIPAHTYKISDEDRTLTLVGSLSAAKVQFPPARLNPGRQLHLLFRATPASPTVTSFSTGGTIPTGVWFVVTTFLLTTGGESLPSLPTLVQTTSATSSVVVSSPGGQTLSGVSAYKVYVGTSLTGPFYLQGSSIPIGTDHTFTAPFATSGSVPPVTNRQSVLPTLLPWGGDYLDPLPLGVDGAVYQSDGSVWHLASTSSAAAVAAASLLGVRAGYRWPSAAEDIFLTANDFSIYGTSGQGCRNVTFPSAASNPGMYVIFSYPPSGSLIPTGADAIDAYANQTAAYQSNGTDRWVRMWSI